MNDVPSQDHSSRDPALRLRSGSEDSLEEAAATLPQQLLARYRESRDSRLLHQLARLAREAGDLAQARTYLLSERSELGAKDYSRIAANAFEMACLAQLRKEPNQALLYLRASLRYAQLDADRAAELRARDLMAQLIPLIGDARLAHVQAYLSA